MANEAFDVTGALGVARFIRSLRYEDLPSEVVSSARRCFLDLLASSFAGIPACTSVIARHFARSFGGAPECSLFGESARVPLPLAVFGNTTVCEALDCDDGYNAVKGHPGAFLFAPLLAFAETKAFNGKEAIASLVAGYEIGMRSGRLVHARYADYHGSGSWGGAGTAAIAARHLGLDESQTLHALGTAEYHGTMAPVLRCVSYPGMVKDGIAWGAFAGVSGAYLAREGFTAAPSNFAAECASGEIASLGSDYLIHKLYFKPYCCCRWAHAPVRAALQLSRQHRFKTSDIDSIRVETFAEACALSQKAPESSEQAQYSVTYSVAAALLFGDVGPEQVLEERYRDERATRLIALTEMSHRTDYQLSFPGKRFAEVKITANGTTYSSGTVAAYGDPDEPLSDAELEDKFLRYVSPHVGDTSARELHARVQALDDLNSLRIFSDALASAGSHP